MGICKDLVTWGIDNSLLLTEAPSLPSDARRITMPEQAADTILLRNLAPFCQRIFGSPGTFLFNRSQYWGYFDVGCVLTDGRVILFENKDTRATRDDLRKFRRDCQIIREKGPLYFAHRWQHHKDYYDEYEQTSLRMFAAFFLANRCDTNADSTDLVTQAANRLGITRDELLQRHEAGNGWLRAVPGRVTAKTRGHTGLLEYLAAMNLPHHLTSITPVLMAPDTTLDYVATPTDGEPPTATYDAILINYAFHTTTGTSPKFLTTSPAGTFKA